MSDHLQSAYAVYHEWKSWDEASFGLGNPELHRMYADIVRRHTREQIGVAIDFGFGNGELLHTLRDIGFSAIGIERNPILRGLATKQGFATYDSLAAEEASSERQASAITAFHVLEHLDKDSLRDTLVQFSKRLKPGGVVIAAFPNGDSPFSASAFNGDITHQTWIGSTMAEQLGKMAGISLSAYTAFPSVSTYSSEISVRLKGTLRCFVERVVSAALARVYYGGTQKVLSPVAIAVWTKE